MPLADAKAFDAAKAKDAAALAEYADFDAYKAAREAKFQEIKASDEVVQKSGAASYEEFAGAQKALKTKNMENLNTASNVNLWCWKRKSLKKLQRRSWPGSTGMTQRAES